MGYEAQDEEGTVFGRLRGDGGTFQALCILEPEEPMEEAHEKSDCQAQ